MPHHTPDPVDDYEDEPASYEPAPDPLSAGVGSTAYMHRHTVDECVERFADSSAARFPDTFDRLYFDAPGGPLLVDVLQDGTSEQMAEERERKHVAFKTAWCAENGRRYLAVPESDVTPEKVRALLAPASARDPRVSQPGAKPAVKRGAIQRPKAAAA